MKAFITGGAGFIGSNLVDRLLAAGHDVTVFDNFSTGRVRFLEEAMQNDRFHLITGDLLEANIVTAAMAGAEIVFHLAANADVRYGTSHPRKDLEQNTLVTFNVLEAMRSNGIRRIAFSSTGSIYGEPPFFPTPENAPFPIQTSFYGASKLACEGLIEAFCESFGFQAYIFRFVSILGERYTHGHVFDFYNALIRDPRRLRVCGNGHQRKSYLYVQDCIDAMLIALDNSHDSVNIFNLGTAEYCEVNDSIAWICQHLSLAPQLDYTGGERGWVGDSPFIFLDCARIRSLGWAPRLSIQEGVLRTLEYLRRNSWIMEGQS